MKRVQNLRNMSDDQLKNRLMSMGSDIQRAHVYKSGWAVANPPHAKMLHNLRKELIQNRQNSRPRRRKRNADDS